MVSVVTSQQDFLHGVSMFSLCLRGYSPIPLASSHNPKTISGVRLIDGNTFPLGVSVDGCLSLCVSPAIVWQPVHSTSYPITAVIGAS